MEFTEIIDQLTPDIQIETDWTSGLTTLPSEKKKLLLLGQPLSTGTETVPTGTTPAAVKRITSVAKAIEWYGKGSHLAIMAEAALRAAPKATIYAAPYKLGTAATAGTGTLTITGTATGVGELRAWIGGRLYKVGISASDTPTIIGAAIAAEVNAAANGPTTAVNTTGTVVFTARNTGTSSSSIRTRCEITQGIVTAASFGAVALSAGTVDGDPTVQLAAIQGDRYHLIALDTCDTTAAASLKADREARSRPAEKKWGVGIMAHVGTTAASQTFANAIDSYRVQVVWLQSCDQPIFELSAAFAGLRARYGCRPSLDDEEVPGITAPYDATVWPDSGTIETQLEEGIVPLEPQRGSGAVRVVRSVVTRQTAPLSYRDHMIAEKSDYTDETVISRLAKYKGKTLKVASPPGQADTVTPQRATATLNEALYDLEKQDVVQGVKKAIKDGLNFAVPNATNPDRIDLGYQWYPTRTAHLIAGRKTYVTSY